MAKDKTKEQQQRPPMDEDVAVILKEGEAGVGAAMSVLEGIERVYYAAAAASAPATPITTTSSTW